MKPNDPAVDADACMASIIGHGNICTCIKQSICGRFILTGSAVRRAKHILWVSSCIILTDGFQDHMCGLWTQELHSAKEAKDVSKNVPLICFLRSDHGMPLTCGFGKLGESEIQCFAGFDSGFIAMWTVKRKREAFVLFDIILRPSSAAISG